MEYIEAFNVFSMELIRLFEHTNADDFSHRVFQYTQTGVLNLFVPYFSLYNTQTEIQNDSRKYPLHTLICPTIALTVLCNSR